METGFEKLLEGAVLSEDTKAALSTAWKRKLDEARSEIRDEEAYKLREEFASRFESDKSDLVEAMNLMITDSLSETFKEIEDEKKELVSERKALSDKLSKADAEKEKSISEHAKVMEKFILNVLSKEIRELNESVKEIGAEKDKFISESKEAEAKREEESDKKLDVLESFVRKQLAKELNEFQQDKRQLVETRVKLITEGRAKMAETRKAFIERASRIVESTIEERLTSELTQLRSDLKEAKQLHFGRKLFEAFQEEFLSSHLSEGTKVKKLMTELDVAKRTISESATRIAESKKVVENMQRRINLAEDKAQREKTLNTLLAPLNRENRKIMSELLESVQTPALKAAFDRNLPHLMESGASSQGRRMLSETSAKTKPVEVTGNRTTRLVESTQQKDVDTFEIEINDLKRLAGIKK